MFGLSPIGVVHTILSLLALAAGIAAFARHGLIASRDRAGNAYLWLTVVTCVTGFFIFRHGGFGKPHALGIVVLVVLAAAWVSETGRGLARRPLLAAGLYSFSFFLSLIPAITETSTRLPLGQPLLASPEDPALQTATGLLFIGFIVATALQLRRLRSRS
jgi:peptidoglycan/LPS O-acetylase OafA/YrhL